MVRASKVCSRAGCPHQAHYRGLCVDHAREYETTRGTNAQRGYDSAFRRASHAAKANATHCDECGAEFTESNPATGGHRVAVRNGGNTSHGIVAQCRRCNLGWRRTGL